MADYPDYSQPLEAKYPDYSKPIEQVEQKQQAASPSQDEYAKTVAGYYSNPISNLRDFIYGMGSAGAGIAKLFNKNAPDMPDVRSAHPNPLAQALGSYGPFAVAGGPGLLGSSLASGAYGATQFDPKQKGFIDTSLNIPQGGRTRNALEDMAINTVFHGANKLLPANAEPAAKMVDFKPKVSFSPGESEFTNVQFKPPAFLEDGQKPILSDRIAQDLHQGITRGRNLEQTGQSLASDIHNSYKEKLAKNAEDYKEVFDAPSKDISYQTGEPIKAKDKLIHDSDYLENNKNADFEDENVNELHNNFLNNPSVQNAHNLQSELGSEIGYLKKQNQIGVLDGAGKNKLRSYAKARDVLKQDIKDELNNVDPSLGEKYDTVTKRFLDNIVPYHSDKSLKAIAEGRIKNPTSTEIAGIFKNPEENINKVVSDLPQESEDKIVHLGMAKTQEENSAGLSSYINPYHDQLFDNLKSNFASEKQAAENLKNNADLVSKLKASSSKSNADRIAMANKRAAEQKAAHQEAMKIAEGKHKQIMSDYENSLKLREEKSSMLSGLTRKILGGAVGVGVTHGLGIDPKDLLGGMLGRNLFKK
jgi:hypothetical protein